MLDFRIVSHLIPDKNAVKKSNLTDGYNIIGIQIKIVLVIFNAVID